MLVYASVTSQYGLSVGWLVVLVQAAKVAVLVSEIISHGISSRNFPSPSSLLSSSSTGSWPVKSNQLWSLCGMFFSQAQPCWASLADTHWVWQGSLLLPPNNPPAVQLCPRWLSTGWQSCFAATEALLICTS